MGPKVVGLIAIRLGQFYDMYEKYLVRDVNSLNESQLSHEINLNNSTEGNVGYQLKAIMGFPIYVN